MRLIVDDRGVAINPNSVLYAEEAFILKAGKTEYEEGTRVIMHDGNEVKIGLTVDEFRAAWERAMS